MDNSDEGGDGGKRAGTKPRDKEIRFLGGTQGEEQPEGLTAQGPHIVLILPTGTPRNIVGGETQAYPVLRGGGGASGERLCGAGRRGGVVESGPLVGS